MEGYTDPEYTTQYDAAPFGALKFSSRPTVLLVKNTVSLIQNFKIYFLCKDR